MASNYWRTPPWGAIVDKDTAIVTARIYANHIIEERLD